MAVVVGDVLERSSVVLSSKSSIEISSECIPRLILGEFEGRKWRKKEQAVKLVFSKWMLRYLRVEADCRRSHYGVGSELRAVTGQFVG
jgi:hypothetical protein